MTLQQRQHYNHLARQQDINLLGPFRGRRLTRTPLSHMLLCPMKARRKVLRSAPVMSPSARLSLLSPKRQGTIRLAFERPREFVLLSVRAMAKRLGTDPATMIRIVRGMQFASYRDFQHYVHELSIAHATSLDTMQTGPT